MLPLSLLARWHPNRSRAKTPRRKASSQGWMHGMKLTALVVIRQISGTSDRKDIGVLLLPRLTHLGLGVLASWRLGAKCAGRAAQVFPRRRARRIHRQAACGRDRAKRLCAGGPFDRRGVPHHVRNTRSRGGACACAADADQSAAQTERGVDGPAANDPSGALSVDRRASERGNDAARGRCPAAVARYLKTATPGRDGSLVFCSPRDDYLPTSISTAAGGAGSCSFWSPTRFCWLPTSRLWAASSVPLPSVAMP